MQTRLPVKSQEAEAFDKARHAMAKAFTRLVRTQSRDVLDQEIEATANLLRLTIEVHEAAQ